MKKRNAPVSTAGGHTQRGQCAKRVSILDAAAEVFCREGFSGGSIDEIAAEACVSRQTVYNHYGEKETLFMAVVQAIMDRANATLFSILATFPENGDNLEDDLTAFAVRLNKNCICNHDGKFIRRLVQMEGERYPHLFEIWRKQGPGKIATALSALLARLAHVAPLKIDDFDLAAKQFLALISAELQMTNLFGGAPAEEELEKAARAAVRTFLRAYADRQEGEAAADLPQRSSQPA
ncbi:TetR/AcrR family transcriptional regulator [Sinorhizobium numidicum]|uniref:TetR/AcrR family transcriptional regulator n=1 Tax=Sinorhizobium numidicum TaxID=680248 RepID=A0ABY8CSD2_9HYPH|nr:TetR/AcrR family transcriptional regulator [Sinorhizobium numidicum]WEX74260.1 TetR/AcrR family transcriptional regulator [Sinorhizobium numidicum]WEX80245.1 TetR/AcrR family transcriptional regulator [Sinorhizobium numidicum]